MAKGYKKRIEAAIREGDIPALKSEQAKLRARIQEERDGQIGIRSGKSSRKTAREKALRDISAALTKLEASGRGGNKKDKKDERLLKQMRRSKYDAPPGTWIHIWRG